MLEKDDAHIIVNAEMKTFGHGFGLGLMSHDNFTTLRPEEQGQGQGNKTQG